MRAPAICLETVPDADTFAEYRKAVMPTLAPFGGTFLVRGGDFTVIEGEWPHQRIAILAFPSRAEAEGWYASPAYRAILPLRLKSMASNAVIVDAVD